MDTQLIESVKDSIQNLSDSQVVLVDKIVRQFTTPGNFYVNPNSDILNKDWVDYFANLLFIHHATSYAPFAKEKFEYGFIEASKSIGRTAEKTASKTFKGRDLTLDGIAISLKTQADSKLREDTIHISKFMELGKGDWDFEKMLQLFFSHLNSYDRIFTFRTLEHTEELISYELVEIPKSLLLEASNGEIVESTRSKATENKPATCYIKDENTGKVKFALYFDGKAERKLQIKSIDKSLCIVHATWKINLIL